MAEHTAGSWVYQPEEWTDDGEYREPAIYAIQDKGPVLIATVRIGLVETPHNGPLLAAAPKLAEALKAIYDFAQPEIQRGPAGVEWVRSMDLAEAALKAAGLHRG